MQRIDFIEALDKAFHYFRVHRVSRFGDVDLCQLIFGHLTSFVWLCAFMRLYVCMFV